MKCLLFILIMAPSMIFAQNAKYKEKLSRVDSTILKIVESDTMCMISKRYATLEEKYHIIGVEFSKIEFYLGKPISVKDEKVCNGERCLHDKVVIYTTSSCYNSEVKGKIIMYLLKGQIAAVHLKRAG